ncbi:MAG: response regulator [Polyangiaceae bacterium]|nr:response regulator [Polyangiaceae bacterium]
MRLLVVDDEAALLFTLGATLELEGIEVEMAESGTEALRRLRETKFDVLLTDIRMPEMSGLELFRQVRAIAPELPVVMMTAFALETVVDDAIGEGIYTVVSKPFDVDHVVEILRRSSMRPYVLVVDAHASEADEVSAKLAAAGLRTTSAYDGGSAAQKLESGPIDICVASPTIPEGTKLLEGVRKSSGLVALIAVADKGAGGAASPQGATAASVASGWIKKPVSVRELLPIIARVRGRAAAH